MPSAQVTISQLPAAGAITGTELVPIVQNGLTVHTTTAAISSSPNQTQTFLTLNQEPTLPNSRYLAGNNGVTLVDGGAQSDLSIELTGTALSLQNAASGLLFKVSGNIVPRTLESGSSGISVANGLGVAGNPSISLSGRVLDLQTLGGSSGLVALTAGSVTAVDILGTANQITVVNGSGPSNPTISLVSNPVIPGLQGMVLPKGTTGDRASVPVAGEIRYNTSTSRFEGYTTGWNTFGQGDGTVTSVNISSSSSGLSFTGGPITTSGTITLVGVPTLAGNLQGGSANRIAYQTGVDTTSFISAPTLTDTYLKWSGSSYVWAALPGSGTVTSVGLALPSEFTISGSPVTTTGTLTGAWASQTNNLFFASPDGTSGTPSFRAIVPADVPTLNQNTTGNAATATTATNIAGGSAGSIPYQTGTNTTTMLAAGTGVLVGGTSPAYSTTPSLTGTNFTGIPNAALNNSSVTYNGVTVALGASGTITAANPNALTIGTGLSGGSYDGSAPITIAIDSTVVTLTGIQTLTNKSISGATNTLSNIGNSSLTNSSVTFNGVNVSLGGSGTITANTTQALTFNNSGSGAASGTAFDGSTAYTISYNTVGASPLVGSTSLTTLGTITTGVWNGTAIANNYLANSSLTIGSTNIALGATSLTLAGLTSVTLTQNPTTALQVATKQYVDGLVSSGITYHTPVKYEVPNTTGNLNATYNNGTAGVGATLTNAGTLAAFAPDGPTASQFDRILVYNQTNAFENGVYEVTTVGDGSTPWVLTRTTDADTYALKSPNGLGEGDAFFVTSGNTGAGETYVCNTVGTITFGTTAINFVQVSSSQVYSAGVGLTLTGTQFSISNTGIISASYGTQSSVPSILVNAQGQLISAIDTPIGINGNQITSGTVGSAYLTGSYTGITGVGTLTAGTWNATTIGVPYGGTGLTSYATGDLLYASATTTLSKLAIGTNTQILTSSGSAPQWTSPSSITVGTATNAVNVGVTADSTNATRYLGFYSATTGNVATLVDSDLTYNPSTNTLTGGTGVFTSGISGGTF